VTPENGTLVRAAGVAVAGLLPSRRTPPRWRWPRARAIAGIERAAAVGAAERAGSAAG
jgi:hypothetical protein